MYNLYTYILHSTPGKIRLFLVETCNYVQYCTVLFLVMALYCSFVRRPNIEQDVSIKSLIRPGDQTGAVSQIPSSNISLYMSVSTTYKYNKEQSGRTDISSRK